MRSSFLFICILTFATQTFAQLEKGQIDLKKVPTPNQHYLEEYTFDQPSDPAMWEKQNGGLNVAFASTDELYLRSEVPSLPKQTQSWEATGWRGERVSAQVLVWSKDTLEQVRLIASDLVNDRQQILGKSAVKVNLVRYVVSNFPYGAKISLDCPSGSTDTAYLMPDRFENVDRFDLPGKTVRPVWISLDIPAEAEPGAYKGTIEVKSTRHPAVLNVQVNVLPQLLPKPHDWKYRLDLWQNPWVVAEYFHVEPWSAEHIALLKKHLKLYADAGGKYITTYAVHSPWSDNSYRLEGTMIDWLKRKDGSWNFDYTIFDQYVQLSMDAGIDEAITIYTPVPWGHRFRYRDEASGNYVNEEWSPETAAFKSFWNIFLTDLKSHLQKKGWLEKTYLGINENPLNITIAAAKVIKEHSADWKITYAGDWHAELSGLLNDYSPIIGREPGKKELRDRKALGFTTTYYVCCTPSRPNNFVFSPPIEGAYISWYAASYGYDGFLRWAYDAWPADPLRDARHTFWPAGDCFLVYPGGGSSIRLEKLREGIVDFEKIRIVREIASKSSNKKVKSMMAEFEKHLGTFTGDADYSKRDFTTLRMTDAVHKGRAMLDGLVVEIAKTSTQH